jgi:hypothetical protein
MPSEGDYKDCGNYRLAHWQRAGGYDGNTLHYGNWNAETNLGAYGNYAQIVWSNYAYRNVPLGQWGAWHVADELSGKVRVPRTKPLVTPQTAGPMFKTTRVLAGRALVVDSFSKGAAYDALGHQANQAPYNTLAGSQMLVGMGMFGHRDGYNVLYGDWHAAWYGDPQQKILWHTQGVANAAAQNGYCNTLV